MAMYADIEDIRARYDGVADDTRIESLIDEAEIIVDCYKSSADIEKKKLVVVRMVVRALGVDNSSMPIGASQGTVSALGYSQTWTMQSSGSVGELYISKTEKRMLGYGDAIGASSPLEVI